MRVIGTAGHVDHGKSTLVQALSGINPDRLQEEKKRGMTIDLGFAWIDIPIPQEIPPSPAGQNSPKKGASAKKSNQKLSTAPDSSRQTIDESVGIVDVPGHIDFIKNMLAGVGGIDAAMLIIAADEGVMPQTREHLAILDLLGVPSGIVVLTKVDLVADEPDWLDLIELDVVELLQTTRLADAPILRVSATTGEGLNELQQMIGQTLSRLEPRRNRARPRLPIDRIFTLSGFGTVVTGTLSDGSFTVGDAVEILPQGIEARVRGLQTHKKQIWQGEPGSRLAINLSNVAATELRRGNVVARPSTLRSTVLTDVAIRLLPDAEKPLVHNQQVDFFSGATESKARVRLLGAEVLEPGQEGWLQLRLERPCVLTSGDRYILRQPSPSATLGGGIVLNPHPQRRWRRFDESVIERLRVLAQGSPDEILLQTIARFPFLSREQLLTQSGLDLEIGGEALTELQEASALIELDMGTERLFMAIPVWQSLTAQLQSVVELFHKEQPLRRGMAREELRSRLLASLASMFRDRPQLPVRTFNAIIERTEQEELFQANDSSIWRHGYEISLNLQQQAMIDEVLNAFAQNPFSPPTMADSLRILGDEQNLLEYLIESGQMVRLGGNVLFRAQDAEEMENKIRRFIEENGAITLAQTRDLFQTSRKYAQAFLEDLDTRRITRREEDLRVLR
ncbi:MAG: selenocysteine-specific translation elongation factor [Chloroflexota bacterium]